MIVLISEVVRQRAQNFIVANSSTVKKGESVIWDLAKVPFNATGAAAVIATMWVQVQTSARTKTRA